MLTKEYVAEFFEYKNGFLYRKKRTSRNTRIGDVAGTIKSNGYCYVDLQGKRYGQHRLIFLLHHGFLPKEIDHIDGNPSNNKINNLREATRSQNNRNQRIHKTNNSGVKNVCFCKKTSKWKVQLTLNNKNKNFGRYKDLELAELVATEARNKYHGGFARHF